MGNLILYYGDSLEIKRIVKKYQDDYQARIYKIESVKKVSFLDKIKSVYMGENIPVKRCTINLSNYDTIIVVSGLWFNKIPVPVVRFLEQQTGKIKKVIYVLYNRSNEDYANEFNKMDRILNLRREKSYFITFKGKEMNVRVYQ